MVILLKYKVLFFSIALLAVMGVTIPLPVLPAIARRFSLSIDQVGWVTVAYTLPGVIIALVAGILADRFGRKAVLLPGIILFGLGGLLCAFSLNFFMLILFRIIQGMGGGVIGVLYSTLPADMYGEEDLPKVMGQISAVASIGVAIFPAIGGLLGEIVWHAPFWVSIFAFPVAWLGFYLPLAKGSNMAKWKEYFIATKDIITNSKALILFSLTFLCYCIYYGPVNTYFPMMVHGRFDVSPAEIGNIFIVLAVGIGMSAFSLGWLNKNIQFNRLILLAGCGYFLAQLSFVIMPSMKWMIVPLIFEGLAQGITLPIIAERIAVLAPTDNRGAVMAVNGSIFRFSQSMSPLIFGLVWTYWGWHGPYILGMIFSIFILCIVFLFIKNKFNII